MNIIRRAILALALIAGLAPAIAQVPSPVPALPDTERRTTYSLTASVCNCTVNFALYGDSTDYANWLEVFVNGALLPQAGNWTITSPTGPLSTIPRPVTDAVLNFTAAQTGTVQIVGARRPRRTSQFSENRGVAARDLNQALTDIIAQNRETWDKINDVTGRAVLAAPGETLALLPKAASRANQGACFDSNGNLTSCVGIPSSSISAGTGIALTGTSPTVISANISAGTGITFTGTNPITISAGSQVFSAKSYGAACDGSTDDTTALSNWIAAINGSAALSVTGELAAGNCQISSATAPNGLIITRDNVTIDGKGASLTVTGTSNMNMVFSSSDHSHVHYKSINFIGNNVASGTGFAVGGAIGFTNASTNIYDLEISGSTFTNFAGNYWVYVETLGGFNNSIQYVSIHDNTFTSQSGNCLGPTSIAINCSFVLVYGIGSNPPGTGPLTPNSFIRTVSVDNNIMRADYVKTGVQIYDNVQDATITRNKIYNAGQLGGTTDDHGSYAIMNYENGSFYSAHSIIANNYIFNVRDNCLYMAGPWINSVVSGNVCDTQTSTVTATLPKGGLSLNGSYGATVTNNRLVNIAADGITLVAPATSQDGEWVIADNYVNGSLDGIKLLNSGVTASKVSVANNTVVANQASATGILANLFAGASYTGLKIDDNHISGGTYGIRFVPNSGSLTLNNVSVSRNIVSSPSTYGIDVSQITAGGPVTVDGNQVSGSPATASFNITNTVNGIFQNNVCSLQGSGAGACWNTAGAQGTMQNNSFDRIIAANVITTNGATDLGRVKPTWTPASSGSQVVVQNMAAVETGTAPNKYVVREWFYNFPTTAWLDQRLLTGN